MTEKRPLVPKPCHEDWDKLTAEERGHFCTVCQTKVWDLSSLTKRQAAAFLRDQAGDVCVSYREDAQGRLKHRPEALVPVGQLVRRLPAAAGLTLALAACTPAAETDVSTNPAPQEPSAREASGDKPQPTGDEPEDPSKPPELERERHVKGKWERPEDDPNLKPTPPAKRERHVKGKWANPDDERKPELGQPPQRPD